MIAEKGATCYNNNGIHDMKTYKVSELTEQIKNSLEKGFPSLSVEGEISNWRPASSGHVYFSLKDSTAIIQAVMFKNKLGKLDFQGKDGMLVRIHGQLSVYAARGNYQIICDSMEQAGIGALLLKLEELKRRLTAEGLFDSSKKRMIPPFPSQIAVITSPTGAAIRDILNILSRRNASINILILPALVQGLEAPQSIVRQIETANLFSLGDVIIIGRGGGSIEDLLPFSDEAVVRAVACSKIPVISAVGHETDWSLCDFAADLRAPTPSAAAELVTQTSDTIISRVHDFGDLFEREIRLKIEKIRLTLARFAPENLELQFRKLEQPWLNRFDDAKESLIRSFRERIQKIKTGIEKNTMEFEARSPQAILSRGYAIVSDTKTGKIVKDSSELIPGDEISLIFAKGKAVAVTKEIDNEEIR